MFLNVLRERNPKLIDAVVKLHGEGKLEANTYVMDLETIRANAAVIASRAKQVGLKVYGMTKQIGYNPIAQKEIVKAGIPSFVAVDWMGARQMTRQDFVLGHVGHLVQPPKRVIRELLQMQPEVFTVFSLDKAKAINEEAKKLHIVQNILLRVYGENPRFYPGHEGGFFINDLIDAAREISKLSNLRIVGVTSFPCMLFDKEAQDVRPTTNFDAVVAAARLLEKELNVTIEQINAPGTTSSDVFEIISRHGGTHVEPGHGLTGTTPLATVKHVAEKPALLYLSEVSHMYNGRAHVFGGGLYSDRVKGEYQLKVLVGSDLDIRNAELIPDSGIDYYGYVDGAAREGEPVIFGFRPQIFHSRGQTAVIDGVEEGNPRVLGFYDSQGNSIVRT